MSKSKQPPARPRKRKAPATAIVPAAPVEPTPVESSPAPPAVLVQVVDMLRTVAVRMIDIADAAAEAVTRRLAGRT